MRQREDGCCYAYSKADGTAYALPRSEYPRLKQEWMAGRAFFEGYGFYGSTLILKLGDIVAVSDCSSDALMAGRADKDEDEREDAIT